MAKVFEVFQKLADDNNSAFKCASLAENIIKAEKEGHIGGEITIGVDEETIVKYCLDSKKYIGGLIIVDKEVYDEYEKRLKD